MAETGVDLGSLETLHSGLHSLNLQSQTNTFRQLSSVLESNDLIGLSFWVASGLHLSASAFFFFQVFLVPRRWANSMIVCGIITGVAWHHYMYMKDIWADTKKAPTVYRYMDWLITVPLQVVEFHLILAAANPADKPPIITSLLFFKLLAASLTMLVFGYLGETNLMDTWAAYVLGLMCWFYILYEVYIGDASIISGHLSVDEAKKFLARISGKDEEMEDAADDGTRGAIQKALNTSGKSSANAAYAVALKEFKKPEAQVAFEILRVIILLGWALYPVGYVLGQSGTDSDEELLNGVYNLADLVNKVAFGLAIYFAAGSQGEREKEMLHKANMPTIDELLARKATSLEVVARSLQEKLVATGAGALIGGMQQNAPGAQGVPQNVNMMSMQQQAPAVYAPFAEGPVVPAAMAGSVQPQAPATIPPHMLGQNTPSKAAGVPPPPNGTGDDRINTTNSQEEPQATYNFLGNNDYGESRNSTITPQMQSQFGY